MAIAAVGRLAYALPYLVSDVESWAAVDVKLRHAEVRAWFEGQRVYGELAEPGDYPPASYLLLWPLLGWLPLEGARWLWAATALTSLGALGLVTVRAGSGRDAGVSSADPHRLRTVFLALLPFSLYPTQVIVYFGQIGIHVIAACVVGFAWLVHGRPGAVRTVGASALLLFALVKPTLSAPFVWVLLFRPRWLHVAFLVVASYVAITLWASAFQPGGMVATVFDWFWYAHGRTGLITGSGTSNLHRWLELAGGERWAFPASLLVLAGHGLWTYRHRVADPWLLLGVAAIVARFWVHHRAHDDLLLLVPMLALFRIAASGSPQVDSEKREGVQSDVMAGLLFAALWLAMHVPNWAFTSLTRFVTVGLEIGQTVLWLVALGFLMRTTSAGVAAGERHAPH
jgi:hypothetical protein